MFNKLVLGTLLLHEIKGIHITRQGLRVYRNRLDQRTDPRGHPYDWIGGDSPTGTPEEGTDVGALAAGYISITPFQLDLTMYSAIPTLGDWEWHTGRETASKPPAMELRSFPEAKSLPPGGIFWHCLFARKSQPGCL